MKQTKTGIEVQELHIERMGFELGAIFNRIHNEVIYIHAKWNEFESLFGTDPIRIDLMNKIAPRFFYHYQNLLLENILLGITRITDSKKTRNKKDRERLTIHWLTSLIEVPLRGEIKKDIANINTETLFARNWRNRKIAHIEKDLALNKNHDPLPPATRDKLTKALSSLRKMMNKIQLHYFEQEFMYQESESLQGYHLLLKAEDGTKYEELKLKFLKTGRLTTQDFQH